MKLGVLASGGGTNLAAIIDAGLPVTVVVADRPCAALDVAGAPPASRPSWWPGTPTGPTSTGSPTPSGWWRPCKRHDIDVVAMAGFGTVLAAPILDAFPGRVLNTHPALLPAFKGWHAVADALAAGVKVTGCTVHVATIEVDEGPILAQEEVAVLPGDTVESLHERIKTVERRLFPATIRRFLELKGELVP